MKNNLPPKKELINQLNELIRFDFPKPVNPPFDPFHLPEDELSHEEGLNPSVNNKSNTFVRSLNSLKRQRPEKDSNTIKFTLPKGLSTARYKNMLRTCDEKDSRDLIKEYDYIMERLSAGSKNAFPKSHLSTEGSSKKPRISSSNLSQEVSKPFSKDSGHANNSTINQKASDKRIGSTFSKGASELSVRDKDNDGHTISKKTDLSGSSSYKNQSPYKSSLNSSFNPKKTSQNSEIESKAVSTQNWGRGYGPTPSSLKDSTGSASSHLERPAKLESSSSQTFSDIPSPVQLTSLSGLYQNIGAEIHRLAKGNFTKNPLLSKLIQIESLFWYTKSYYFIQLSGSLSPFEVAKHWTFLFTSLDSCLHYFKDSSEHGELYGMLQVLKSFICHNIAQLLDPYCDLEVFPNEVGRGVSNSILTHASEAYVCAQNCLPFSQLKTNYPEMMKKFESSSYSSFPLFDPINSNSFSLVFFCRPVLQKYVDFHQVGPLTSHKDTNSMDLSFVDPRRVSLDP